MMLDIGHGHFELLWVEVGEDKAVLIGAYFSIEWVFIFDKIKGIKWLVEIRFKGASFTIL